MLPSQIVDNLPEGLSATEIEAGVLLRRGLDTPMGETAIVRRGDEWIALVRESIFAPFTAIALARGHQPRLEGEGFDEFLVLETAAGEVHRLRVSGFERGDLVELLGPEATSGAAGGGPGPLPQALPPPPPHAPPSPPPSWPEPPTPRPDFAFSRQGPIAVESVAMPPPMPLHRPAHRHEPPHEHAGSRVIAAGADEPAPTDALVLVDEAPPDRRTTLDEDVRRIAAQQGVNFAVMHYAEVAGVNLHEANEAVKRLLGRTKGQRSRRKRPQDGSRRVEAAVLDLLRSKKKTAAILLYRSARKVNVTEAREAVEKLAAAHGIDTSTSSMATLVLGLAIVVAVLALLVFLVK